MDSLTKKEAAQRVKTFGEEFIQRNSSWIKIPTPELLLKVPETTDFITFSRPYENLTNLVILIAIKYHRRLYEVNIGWSDTLPLDNPLKTNIKMKFPLEYHRDNGLTEEFDFPYMITNFERVHSALTRSRYKVQDDYPTTEFNLIFSDLETIAIEYWKIMLKRRFGIEAIELTL